MTALIRVAPIALLAVAIVWAQPRDSIFQTSTIDALLQGVYDGEMTFAELRKRGDFGIGTFNGVDGEMIAFGGRYFQVLSTGRAVQIRDSMQTPFATVTHFRADITLPVPEALALRDLQARIDEALPSPNYFYAIRITGRFESVKTRSVPKQQKPYAPLVEVVKTQPVFDLKDVEGTLAGFRCPEFAKGVNVPGYHIHFLNKDANAGGHVLDCVLRRGKIEIDTKRGFEISLPATAAFSNADFLRDRAHELEKVEK